MPAAAIIGTAQSACLGMKDIKTPLAVLLVAAVINLLGDFLLVPRRHMWIGGAAGAAWATVISQFVAVELFYRYFTNVRGKSERNTNHVDDIGISTSESMRVINISDAIIDLQDTQLSTIEDATIRFDTSMKTTSSAYSRAKGFVEAATKKKSEATAYILRLFASEEASKTKTSFSTKGMLSHGVKRRRLARLPRVVDIQGFLPYVMPCTITGIGRVST